VALFQFLDARPDVGRPETDVTRRMAMNTLGGCLSVANHHEDALTVQEAELAVKRRLGAPEASILITQNNLAGTYSVLGRAEVANRMLRDVYSGRLRLLGEEHERTLIAGNNYATTLIDLKRFEEVRSLMRGLVPVARRVLGESDILLFRMRLSYAEALYKDASATHDDIRKAVTTIEELERAARRVLGGAHPLTKEIERVLRDARAALRARETPQS